ncbi:MAG: GIY-YIG nuclease family protein [Smithellaceae bacterium]
MPTGKKQVFDGKAFNLVIEDRTMKRKDQTGTGEWLVYILRCADNSLYTGITKNLESRLAAHASGTASKYTRSRRPAILVATSGKLDKGSALRLENQIKKMPKARKIDALVKAG